jgi:adenylylsulfate kinase-like enzyme
MKTKVLIFGLPGSGKTTFAKKLQLAMHDCCHINADAVRQAANDWDFSMQGRIQQAHRMHSLAEQSNSASIVCDFVCPYASIRDALFHDYIKVFMNTIESSRYSDTNNVFEHPMCTDYEITNFNQIDGLIEILVAKQIKPCYNTNVKQQTPGSFNG